MESSLSSATSTQPALARKLNDSTSMRILARCYGYLHPYRLVVAGAYLFAFFINGLNIVYPQIIRFIIDQGLSLGNTRLVGLAVLGLLGLAIIKGIFTFFQQRWLEVASQNVAYDMRNDIQSKLTDLSFSYHDRTEAGQLLSRTIQDVERIRFLTGRATWRILDSLILMAGTAAVLVWMNPQLAVLALLVLPLLIHRGLVYGRQARPLSATIQQQLGTLTSRLEQSLRGTRVVKAFAQEDAETARFDAENETWFRLSASNSRLESLNTPLMDLIANAGSIIILLYGGWLAIQGQITLGELVAFTTYLAQLANPVRVLGRMIPAVAMASAAGERIFAILDADPEVKDRPGAIALPPLRGHVRFEKVTLAYGGRRPAVRDITFEALPGQVVALLGATGAGKSTLTYLISRFYDPTSGKVTIDGYDLRGVTRASLRRQIGVVLQETTLFAASVRENIAFGRPAASDDDVLAAARAAQAHDFIMQMPNGYETLVGERGVTLSGGQKQRLAIARALLTDPRILILDDATASVDSQTERLIQSALDNLMANRTTFVIAHRLSTMRRADLILVLEQGEIVARGTHASLIHDSPLYADIYQRQQATDVTQAPGVSGDD